MSEHSFVKGPDDEENGVLRYCGKISVSLTPKGVQGQFVYKRTAGMWVEQTFADVLGESVSFETGIVEVGKYQLQEKMPNSDILFTIGTRGVHRGEEGKELLKRMIAASIITQWKGGPGPFLTDLQSNLFYFEQGGILYVVRVFRTTFVSEWNVNMWRVDSDNDAWCAGDVVFTPPQQ
jgi:hypothetical protein